MQPESIFVHSEQSSDSSGQIQEEIIKERPQRAYKMDKHTLVTLNAELLDDKDTFSYRDLQKLCVRLQLGGKGKREDLVEKLQDWHRSRSPVPSPTVKEATPKHTYFTSDDEDEEKESAFSTTSPVATAADAEAISPLPMNV
jgi:hypothetical protein